MLLQSWAEVLNDSFQNVFYGVVEFLPNLIAAIVIFVIGWLIAAGLGRLIAQVVTSIKVDAALKSAGLESVTKRAGVELSAGKFLGALVKLFIIVVFLVTSLEVLGLSEVTFFLRDVVLGYLPQVIVAVLILFIAAVVAELVGRVVLGAAQAANATSAKFLASVSRWAIWVFAILIALDHLQVASVFVQTLFTGVVVAVSLAVGLAFGLGGQQSAARWLERLENDFGGRR